MMINLWDDYLKWLLWRVGFDSKGHEKLMEELHNSPFVWSIPMDENRANDGLRLRHEYFDEIGLAEGDFQKQCSVLEMLIALAIRVDDEYVGNPAEPHPEEFFTEMLRNLGLYEMTNRKFEQKDVKEILSIWLLREFKRDGWGSIFPIDHPKKDQKTCEIWSQMQEYLYENYYNHL